MLFTATSCSRFSQMLTAGVGIVAVVCSVPAWAQDDDLGALADKAQAAMKSGLWQDALDSYNHAVEKFGAKQPLQTFGPQFGAVYYHKGICEIQLKRWADAMKSFEICYRDFPNTRATAANANTFRKLALLRWGEAATGAGQWELALSQYRKFLNERDRAHDAYQQGPMHIGMAVCYYQLGKIPDGNESLEIAMRNKSEFSSPDAGLYAAFEALVGAAIKAGNEQVLLDFIGKNRAYLVISPFAWNRYTPTLLKLAGDCASATMDAAALQIYQLVPSSQSAADEIRTRIGAMGCLENRGDGSPTKKQLEAALADMENRAATGHSSDEIKLAGVAMIHERLGNLFGAYTLYQELETHYANSVNHERNLLNLVRTAAVVASGSDVVNDADTFRKTFPNSAQLPAVAQAVISKLLAENDDKACAKAAQEWLGVLKDGTPEHDLCLHALGAALFHDGRFQDAQAYLEKHAATYPKSRFAGATSYLLAEEWVKLGKWHEAAVLLDQLIENPQTEPSYRAAALLSRADCYRHENQPQDALKILNRLTTEFPNHPETSRALNLTAEIESEHGDQEKATVAYERALALADQQADAPAAEQALVALLMRSSQAPTNDARVKKTVLYAERFWKDYGKTSSMKVTVAMAQVSALQAAGKLDEALAHLSDAISEAATTDSHRLPALIHAHALAFLSQHSPEELQKLYTAFPGIAPDDKHAKSELQYAVIAAFEERVKTGDEAANRAKIKQLYQELKTSYGIKDLSNRILVALGDHLRLTTSTPRESLPFYDEVIARDDASERMPALLGRADVFSASATPADLEKAVADFKRVTTEASDQGPKDYALGRLREIDTAKKGSATP